MDFVREVTVTVVRQRTPAGVPVIVKLLTAVEEFCVVVKKAGAPEPSSFFAETSIVTPWGGIVEVTVTVRGKSVCGDAGCMEPAAGLRVTAKVASEGGGGVFLHFPATPKTIAEVIKE